MTFIFIDMTLSTTNSLKQLTTVTSKISKFVKIGHHKIVPSTKNMNITKQSINESGMPTDDVLYSANLTKDQIQFNSSINN